MIFQKDNWISVWSLWIDIYSKIYPYSTSNLWIVWKHNYISFRSQSWYSVNQPNIISLKENKFTIEFKWQRNSTNGSSIFNKLLSLFKDSFIITAGFCFLSYQLQDSSALCWELTICCLTWCHVCICKIITCICYIWNLSSGWSRFSLHWFKHLCCCYNDSSCVNCLLCDEFLKDSNLLNRNLHSKITSRDHDTIRSLDNLIQIMNCLMILDFTDKLHEWPMFWIFLY